MELNDVRNFLKRGTGHFKVYELYNQFKALKAHKNSKISYEAFELILLKLNKKIIQALREDCYQYIAVNGAESYPKYIREKEFVSRKFWKNICKTVPDKPVVEKPPLKEDTPKTTDPLKDPLDIADALLIEECFLYIKNNGAESYQKFIREKEFVSRTFWDKVCEKFAESSKNKTTIVVPCKKIAEESPKNKTTIDVSFNDCFQYIRKNGVDSYQEYIREKKFVPKRFWNELCKAFLESSISSVNPEIPNIEDDYYKLLPLDWVKMSFSDRIEFAKKVQHPDFLKYIFKMDPKLEGYLKKIRHNPTDLKLYVNIFTIPSETYSEEAKSLLKLFVDALNMTGRARLQFVQCTKPDIIEIREVK